MTLSVDIDNLTPNTEYHIGVMAYTSVGPGAVANLSMTTTSNGQSKYVHSYVCFIHLAI